MRDAFHERFLSALAGDDAALAPWCDGSAARPGLSIYRNTSAKGCADALVAQFPTVQQVVGADWLSAAAVAHAAAHPPRAASLLMYGADFAEWLAVFPPAAEMPFLADLARLDWLWTEAHLAADAPALDASALTGLTPEGFASHRLVLHPAARFATFADGAPSLWVALRSPGDALRELALDDAAEAMLFVRPGLAIDHRVLSPGTHAFLANCAAGDSLAAAAMAALAAEPGLDLLSAFADLVAAGAFTDLRTLT